MSNNIPMSPEGYSPQRLVFIDNLRILLTILVILQHLIVSYGGASGKWYFNNSGRVEGLSWYVMTFVWVLNQAFFMSFFFMLSSFFIPASYDRKGVTHYLRTRVVRLGVPLIAYILVLNPVLSYIAWVQKAGFQGNLIRFIPVYIAYYRGLDVGVLWFIEALLIFGLIYVAWRRWGVRLPSVFRSHPKKARQHSIKNFHIIGFCLLLSGLVFCDRVLIGDSSALRLMGLPRGHFMQYIAFFGVGIQAYRHNWLTSLNQTQGKLWTIITLGLILVLPALLIEAGILQGYFSPYGRGGGWGLRSLFLFAVWEQFTCTAMIISLLVWFREYFNDQAPLLQRMGRDTYAVFIIHAPLLTGLTILFNDIQLQPMLKLAFVFPITVLLCFLLGHFVRQLPGIRNIL